MSIQGRPGRISRRAFLGLGGVSAAALLLSSGPFGVLGARVAEGQPPSAAAGYGPLVPKPPAGGTDPTQYLYLPAEFNYQVISRQGQPMRDGTPTPGILDAMGAFPDAGNRVNPTDDTTILIRNHENRERPGEVKVATGPGFEYDEATFGGNTKLVMKRQKFGMDTNQNTVYEDTVADSFAILGGTSTNCAGGETPFKKWITCEEVVKGPSGGSDGKTSPKKHGYVFEVNAIADGPVPAPPIVAAGRFVHEAAAWRSGVLYLTEDRRIMSDPKLGQIGACFYRYTPTSGSARPPTSQRPPASWRRSRSRACSTRTWMPRPRLAYRSRPSGSW